MQLKYKYTFYHLKVASVIIVFTVICHDIEFSLYGDIMVSFYGSILSLPPTILKTIFVKYQFRDAPSNSKHNHTSSSTTALFAPNSD